MSEWNGRLGFSANATVPGKELFGTREDRLGNRRKPAKEKLNANGRGTGGGDSGKGGKTKRKEGGETGTEQGMKRRARMEFHPLHSLRGGEGTVCREEERGRGRGGRGGGEGLLRLLRPLIRPLTLPAPPFASH
ncbi:hypothetical protein niasHT_003561 [Heterodera trifolii]|uniref:Uncharacterized protein n=1 Tax=Heterodera trifolii TaxID=157864 RepID=A0ABD2LYB2_9BILA